MKIGNLEVYGVIYKITNKVNGKVYIGQTTRGFNKRYPCKGEGITRVYKFHKTAKDSNLHYNDHLLQAIEKYGKKSFDVNKMFDVANTKEELDKKEIYWIEYFDSYRNGYNNNLGGFGSGVISNNETKRDRREKWLEKTGRFRIVCTTLNVIFDNHLDMIDYFTDKYGFEMKPERLFNACDNKTSYVPRKIDVKIKFDFIYAHEYFMKKIYKNERKNTNAPVICINDMKFFTTQNECKKYYGLTNLYDILKSRKNVNEIKSEKKLNIMRYKDYINTIDFKEIEELYESILDK